MLLTDAAWLEEIGSHPANRQVFPVRPYALHLDPPSNARILDVGAHTGANLLFYGRRGYEVVGVEGSPSCCALFEEQMDKCVNGWLHKPVMVCSLIEDYEPDEPFDALLAGELLCYTPYPSGLAMHLARCLRPGGVALVTMPATAQKEYPTHLTLVELAVVLQTVGFRIDWARMLPGLGTAQVSAVRCHKGAV